MPPEVPPLPPPPDVLGGMGKLREALVALRNLEHLLASPQVGPRVLAHVLPELEQSSSSWKAEASKLVGLLTHREEDPTMLRNFESFVLALLDDFAGSLERASSTSMAARARLSLERDVRRLMPSIGSVIDHFELLVESRAARGVPLSLKELLFSRPDTGLDKPLVAFRVDGDAELVEVSLPARVAVRAIGALLACAGPGVGIAVRTHSSGCTLSIERDVESGLVAQLPQMVCIADTHAVVRYALGRYGVQVSLNGLLLDLPRHSART